MDENTESGLARENCSSMFAEWIEQNKFRLGHDSDIEVVLESVYTASSTNNFDFVDWCAEEAAKLDPPIVARLVSILVGTRFFKHYNSPSRRGFLLSVERIKPNEALLTAVRSNIEVEHHVHESVRILLSGPPRSLVFRKTRKHKNPGDHIKTWFKEVVRCFRYLSALREVETDMVHVETFLQLVYAHGLRANLVPLILIYIERLSVAPDSTVYTLVDELIESKQWIPAVGLLEGMHCLMNGWPPWMATTFGSRGEADTTGGRGGRGGRRNSARAQEPDKFNVGLPYACMAMRPFADEEHASFLSMNVRRVYDSCIMYGRHVDRTLDPLNAASRLCKTLGWEDEAVEIATLKRAVKIDNFVRRGKWQLAQQLVKRCDADQISLYHSLLEHELFEEALEVYEDYGLQSHNEPPVPPQKLREQQARKEEMLSLPVLEELEPEKIVTVDCLEPLMHAAHALGFRDAVVKEWQKLDLERYFPEICADPSMRVRVAEERALDLVPGAALFYTDPPVVSEYIRPDGVNVRGLDAEQYTFLTLHNPEDPLSPAAHHPGAVGIDAEWRAVMYQGNNQEHGSGASIVQVALRDVIFLFDLQTTGRSADVVTKAIQSRVSDGDFGHDDEYDFFSMFLTVHGVRALLRELFVTRSIVKLGWDMGNADLTMLRTAGGGWFSCTFSVVHSVVELSTALAHALRATTTPVESRREIEEFRTYELREDLAAHIQDFLRLHLDEEEAEKMIKKARQKLSLTDACVLILGKPLDKSQQLSNWDRRPLKPAQRRYAALDAYALLWSVWAIHTNANGPPPGLNGPPRPLDDSNQGGWTRIDCQGYYNSLLRTIS